MYQIILASGSPRRRQLLADLGVAFRVQTAGVEEVALAGEAPVQMSERLARWKAEAVARTQVSAASNSLIIAADTVVALGPTIYGKPVDAADALRMLRDLRGRWHQVHSGVCVLAVASGECSAVVNTSQVAMRDYSEQEMLDYVNSGDPLDKAGAYAIQHPEFAPVRKIRGCFTGVMGLPMADLSRLLAEHGVGPLRPTVDACERHTDFPCCQRNAGSELAT